MANGSALPSAGTVLAAVVPALLTFVTAAALSTLGGSTPLSVGVGLVVGLLAGQVLRRIRD